ncbi:MAG: hypothetical protein R3A48_00115 [Polyangiales bacterium]
MKAFARGYSTPGFAREAKNLIKLRAFFDAKLRAESPFSAR